MVHLLWLVVLLKLVAHPFGAIDGPATLHRSTSTPGTAGGEQRSMIDRQTGINRHHAVSSTTASELEISPPSRTDNMLESNSRSTWPSLRSIVLVLWLGGAALPASFYAMRIVGLSTAAGDAASTGALAANGR